ncbi:Hsp20/alpha crystallin family protein [Metabacillus fastidiosus]|uniref:Hsp20/alpha crystallin family protein n=1 Tax=Metabacillus fastidiosus TaxID=1458 RepID=UPI003D2E9C8F
MDFDKLKQWLEISQQYQQGDFWETVFEQSFREKLQEGFSQAAPNTERSKALLKNFPKTDIYVTDTAVVVLLEVPGVMREDLFLSVSGNKLVVSGISKLPDIHAISKQTERVYGEFERIIELPEPTDSNHIQAKFENGLVILTYIRKYSQQERIFIK